MDTEVALLHRIVTISCAVFVVIGTLLPLFRRNECSMERLEAKLDRSIGMLGTKLERLRPQLYNLNEKVSQLIGRIFGAGTQDEEDKS